MKAELVDVSETQKQLTIEIPSEIVDAQIERVTRGLSKSARLPGFRPGKVPAGIIRQRFKEQILQEVARDLVPRAVGDALQERGVEPVDEPDIKDFSLEPGQALTFSATFEIVPPFDPGDLSTITVRRPAATVPSDAVDQALERLRDRAARYEPIEGRPIADGDTVVLDIERRDPGGASESHPGVSVTLGAEGSPPGFDDNLLGLTPGDTKTFATRFPEDYAVTEMANTEVTYSVTIKELRTRVVPALDDEFAKDLGDFDTLDTLRERVRTDLHAEAEAGATRQVRGDLVKQLAQRVPFELPAALVDRELDRRVEEFARRLLEQKVDPREAKIDWPQLREAQREPARDAVASALLLDELIRREAIAVETDEVDRQVELMATRLGRTPAAVRAQLEKDGAIAHLQMGLRREKALELAMSRVTVLAE